MYPEQDSGRDRLAVSTLVIRRFYSGARLCWVAKRLSGTEGRALLFYGPHSVHDWSRALPCRRGSLRPRVRYTPGSDSQSLACRVSARTPLRRCCKLKLEKSLEPPSSELFNDI